MLKANLRLVSYTKMKNIFQNPAIFEVFFMSNLYFLSLSLERCLVHSSHRLWDNCGEGFGTGSQEIPCFSVTTFVFDLTCNLKKKNI